MAASGSAKGLGRSISSSLPPRFPKLKLSRKNSDVLGLGKKLSGAQGCVSNQRYERLGDRLDFARRDSSQIRPGLKRSAAQVSESEERGKLNDGFERLGDKYAFPERTFSVGGNEKNIDNININSRSHSNAHLQLETAANENPFHQGNSSNVDTRAHVSTIDFSEITNEQSQHRHKGSKEPKEKASPIELSRRKTFGQYWQRALKGFPRMRQPVTQSKEEKSVPAIARPSAKPPIKLARRQTLAPSQFRGRDSRDAGGLMVRSSRFEMGSIPQLRRQSMGNRTASQSSAGRSKSVARRTSRAYSDFDVSEDELQRSNSQIDLQMAKKILEAKRFELEAQEKELQAKILKKEAAELRKNKTQHPRGSRVRREQQPTTMAADIAKAIHKQTAEATLSSPETGTTPKYNGKTTEPKPFKLGGLRLHERVQKRKEEKKKQDEEEKRRFGKFKARPLPGFYRKTP